MGTGEAIHVQSAFDRQPGTTLSRSQANSAAVGAIVLVHWQIRPEREAEFLDYWRAAGTIRDRTGLVGEFLSEVVPAGPAVMPWITWLLPEPDAVSSGAARHFVNVGLWSNEAAFLKQVAGDFGDDAPMRPFELRRRRRLLLRPECWRVGAAPVPRGDSDGVR